MKRPAAKRQRGIALIALLAVIALGTSWMLLTRLNAESNQVTAVTRQRNAEVLNKAKQALIGYVAQQTAKSNENDPGALPCPESPGSFGDPANEGIAAGSCSLPVVGRLPWRTLGVDKLVDTAGEPLWYVVANGWAKPNSTTNTVINSNCASSTSGMTCWSGQLTVDGTANAAVALIIAPGPAFNVPAATGCAAISQVRPTSGTPDWRNYLECENATYPTADSTFLTTGPSTSFNDQVVKITAEEVLPGIEAAIANRIEREIVPLLNTAYTAPSWGLSGSDKVYPYPAPFANPDALATTFIGSPAITNAGGLLPFAYSDDYPNSAGWGTCTSGTPRCNPTLVSWSNAAPSISSSGGITLLSTCSYWGPTNYAECTGTYTGTPLLGAQITVSGPQNNGAMSLRQIRGSATGFVFWWDIVGGGFTWSTPTPTINLNSDGTFTVSVTVTPPAPVDPLVGVMYWIYVPGNATADHALLDARKSSDTSLPAVAPTAWFARNEWHKLLYYAIAPGYAASGAAPRSCTTGGTCLSVTNVMPAGGQRAILILAGRSIDGSARPSGTLGNYLEFGNATGAFERQAISTWNDSTLKKPFNDRIAVIASN